MLTNLSIISFIFSSLLTFLIIRTAKFHSFASFDFAHGPQKIHTSNIPRVGGLAIISSSWITSTYLLYCDIFFNPYELNLLFTATLIFLIGFTEDLTKKISPGRRLLLIVFCSAYFVFNNNVAISSVDVNIVDYILSHHELSIFFTIFCITGLTNSYNIIDGINGLASMIALSSLIAITYVSFSVNDLEAVKLTVIFAASIAGFFIWNYPKGAIFLGDGGAYLIGFFIAIISIQLILNNSDSISPWFALVVNIYPAYETIFSILRRFNNNSSGVTHADSEHLHSLVYKRLIRISNTEKNQGNEYLINSKTSPFLWILSYVGILPSVLWYDDSLKLQVTCVIYIIVYTLVYFKLKDVSNIKV